jgi:GT2 family glycosyltransferase
MPKSFYKDALTLYAETKQIPFDVWVVDNNSIDTSVSMVRQHFPQVNLIENKENVGFTKANNQAITRCNGNYILLLNPRTT